MKSGIYKITNIVNNKFYIGSSFDINKRKREHIYKLNNNLHHCNYLQNSWNKYGRDNFIFEVLANCPLEYLIKLEDYFIKQTKPQYNTAPVAGSNLGYKHSDKTKDKFKKIIQDRKDKRIINKVIKLTYEDVKEIKRLYKLNYFYKDIAKQYNINPNTIYNIINGKIWKEIPDYKITESDIVLEKVTKTKGYKYSDEFILSIIKEYKETNCTMSSLRVKYGMTKYLDNVLKGKSKKHLQNLI
jgi:hypothetical protein